LFVTLIGILGLIFGSFATAAAYRIPRRESLSKGRSKCPHCGHEITALENIPVFSYVFLRGKCRHCGERISPRYPLTELATGILFALSAWKFEEKFGLIAFCAFFWVLVVLTVIDLEFKLLPNRVVYPSFIVGWIVLVGLALIDGTPERLIDGLVGAVIFGGVFFVLAFAVPAGMGMGDVKLGFVLGSFLGFLDGYGLVLLAMFLAFLSGSIIGVLAAAVTKGGRKMKIPFGPFLALGTAIAVFAGRPILDAYLGSFS
jgi:leader peptidase (prepilin peptidase) / N-methyltransferase